MNYKMMGRFVAQTLTAVTALMIPALIISLCAGEMAATKGFLLTFAIAVILIAVLFLSCKGAPNVFGAKEGLVCAAISWIPKMAGSCWRFLWTQESERRTSVPCPWL